MARTWLTAVKLSNDVAADICDVISLRFFTGKSPSSRSTFSGVASGAAPVETHILENSVGTELHVSPESSVSDEVRQQNHNLSRI